jgi:hypothetical protein
MAAESASGVMMASMDKRRTWTSDQDALVRRLALTHRASEIAEMLGRSEEQVRVYAIRRGIRMEDRSKRRHLRNARKHDADETFFGVIDTEPKAYWLGAMFADGVVHVQRARRHEGVTHRLSLSQHISDRAWLEQFRADLNATNPLKASKNSLALAVSSLQLCDDLRSHGCIERKTHGHPDPSGIPPELIHHFVRGFFDGDGCIHSRIRKTSPDPVVLFSCSPSMAIWLLSTVREGAGISSGGVYAVSSPVIRAVRFPGRRAVESIYGWMYRDATRWMPRKRAVFTSIYGELPCR